jgi:hypothetical protein
MLQTILVKSRHEKREKINNYSHLGHVGRKQVFSYDVGMEGEEENELFGFGWP